MNIMLWILVTTTLTGLSTVIAYRQEWWRKRSYYVFVFLLGFSAVYLPFFPYGNDSAIVRFVYALVSGGFSLQAHQILVKNLYEKLEDVNANRYE